MSVSSINCPFCGVLIEIGAGVVVGACPSCGKALHGPVKESEATKETVISSLEDSLANRRPSSSSDGLSGRMSMQNNPRMLGPYRIDRNIGRG